MTPIHGGLLSNLLQRVTKTPIFVKICDFFIEIVAKKGKTGVFTPNKILVLTERRGVDVTR